MALETKRSSVIVALSLLALAVGCAKSEDDGPIPKFSSVGQGATAGNEEGWAGAAGSSDPDDWAGGGEGGSAGSEPDDWWPGSAGAAGAPSGGTGGAPAPQNAPGCGATGAACCATGDTCADNKAQCCNECSGAPSYTCHCADSYKSGGLCRVCCVVCNNGKVKADPLYVSGSSCGDAAQAWCKAAFGVGADTKSGWRVSCG